jgi:RNA polymerase sigma-70 factor, ECF subfamily
VANLAVEPLKSDDSLIGDVLAGGREAYSELVRRYERQVHAVAWSVLRDHHAAEDVTQESFIKAFCKLSTLRAPGKFGDWLLSIARRRAIDLARGERLVIPGNAMADIASFDRSSDEDAAYVLAEVARLPSHEQQVVMFRYFDGLSVMDIASILSRPVGTITKQLSRALARLRDRLKVKQ